MNTVLLIFLIVFTVYLVISAVQNMRDLLGYGKGNKRAERNKKLSDSPEIDDKKQRDAERARREYENFLNYNGDVQDDIDI